MERVQVLVEHHLARAIVGAVSRYRMFRQPVAARVLEEVDARVDRLIDVVGNEGSLGSVLGKSKGCEGEQEEEEQSHSAHVDGASRESSSPRSVNDTHGS